MFTDTKNNQKILNDYLDKFSNFLEKQLKNIKDFTPFIDVIDKNSKINIIYSDIQDHILFLNGQVFSKIFETEFIFFLNKENENFKIQGLDIFNRFKNTCILKKQETEFKKEMEYSQKELTLNDFMENNCFFMNINDKIDIIAEGFLEAKINLLQSLN